MPARTVTIAAGQSLSTAVGIGTDKVVAILVPSTWTPAPMTVLLSPDNVTFYDVSFFDTDQLFVIRAVPNRWIAARTEDFPPNTSLKLRSGHAGNPIVQLVAQTITLWVA